MRGDPEQVLSNLKDSISKMAPVEDVKEIVKSLLAIGVDPVQIVNTLSQALDLVGKKYESGEYFLSELIMAGVLATEVTNILDPFLKGSRIRTFGKVVIGTVKGDIHDIGKNIVIMMFRSARFEVVDLGIDVSAEKFAQSVRKEKPQVLDMSALLTSTMNEMENVVLTLKREGLRDQVKVLIGGRPITKEFAEEIGADAYAGDAVESVKVVKELVGIKGE